MTTITKPVAKLDGSLLLARKGEAMPAVAATQHNNPALAWGAPAHPQDFQGQNVQAKRPVETATVHQPHQAPANSQTPPIAVHGTHGVYGTHGAGGSARLRPDSFFSAHGRGTHTSTQPKDRQVRITAAERDPVALTMRVEDETYLRLKYLAQSTGRSTQQVLSDALDGHLTTNGVPRSRRLVVKPQ